MDVAGQGVAVVDAETDVEDVEHAAVTSAVAAGVAGDVVEKDGVEEYVTVEHAVVECAIEVGESGMDVAVEGVIEEAE